MSERTEHLAREALSAALGAIAYAPENRIDQIVVIVRSSAPGDEDDTSLAVAGQPEFVGEDAVLTSLLTHARVTARRMGGEVRVINLDDIGQG